MMEFPEGNYTGQITPYGERHGWGEMRQACFLLSIQLQEKPSALKRKHPVLQKIKFIFFNFCGSFAFLNPDPDPGTPLNPDPIRIRIHNTGIQSI